ncbi:hypothetical protein A3860_02415 [Niastella vici]|uniref:Uncharacterized protein n=1 Tax=Niastella vici TaxID=1703345 RepID=A0A1V9G9E3_9BACT|nr:hypothetical protein [Niastella vici]OQP67233.1 hypothetical protein A3860_02415 [Niastella vici]
MHQNPSNELYRELKENDPTRPYVNTNAGSPDLFNGVLICWEDGNKAVFYYPFLVSVKLHLQTEHNVIIMRFTSEIVTLKGYLLNTLLMKFTQRKPDLIDVINPRYVLPETISQPVVIEAVVEERKA